MPEQKYLSSIASGKGCRPRGFVRLLPAASVRDLALLIESHDAQPFLSSARSCPPLPGHRPCCLSGFPACRSSDYRPYLPQGVLACCPSGHRHSTSRQEAWPAVHPTPAVPPGVPPVRAAWPDVFPITDRATGQSCLAIRLHGHRTSHLSGGLWPAMRYNPLIAWHNFIQDDHKYVSVKEACPYLRPDWAGPFFGSFARAGYERMT